MSSDFGQDKYFVIKYYKRFDNFSNCTKCHIFSKTVNELFGTGSLVNFVIAMKKKTKNKKT